MGPLEQYTTQFFFVLSGPGHLESHQPSDTGEMETSLLGGVLKSQDLEHMLQSLLFPPEGKTAELYWPLSTALHVLWSKSMPFTSCPQQPTGIESMLGSISTLRQVR